MIPVLSSLFAGDPKTFIPDNDAAETKAEAIAVFFVN